MDFENFKRIIFDTLKKTYLRANDSNFVTKVLSKAIVIRSRLRNQFLRNKSVKSRMKYNKQRNICVALIRKTKEKYYKDLRLSDIQGNEKCWETVKPLFGNKINGKSQIALVEVKILPQTAIN